MQSMQIYAGKLQSKALLSIRGEQSVVWRMCVIIINTLIINAKLQFRRLESWSGESYEKQSSLSFPNTIGLADLRSGVFIIIPVWKHEPWYHPINASHHDLLQVRIWFIARHDIVIHPKTIWQRCSLIRSRFNGRRWEVLEWPSIKSLMWLLECRKVLWSPIIMTE